MKKNNVVRLDESHLRRIVENTVKQVLKEECCWWGDTKPLEEICRIASQIADDVMPDFDNETDFDESDRARFDLWKWAERVAEEAESFMRCEANNMPINGGEDW